MTYRIISLYLYMTLGLNVYACSYIFKLVLLFEFRKIWLPYSKVSCVSWVDLGQASSYGSLVIDNNILRWSAAPSKSDGYLIKRYKEYRWTLLHRGLWTGTFPLSILAWCKRDFKRILFFKRLLFLSLFLLLTSFVLAWCEYKRLFKNSPNIF